MTDNSEGYNFRKIRELLLAAFTPKTLRRFCQDGQDFKPLLNEFSPGDSLNDMVDKVITYCEKHGLLPDLLKEVEQANPWMYARFKSQLGDPVHASTDTPTPTITPPPTPTSTPFAFVGKVCQIRSGWDTNTIFLREQEFHKLGLPIGTKVTVRVRDTEKSVSNVKLSFTSRLEICTVQLAKRLREDLGVDADTTIEPESDRPNRKFDIVQTSPPANREAFDFQGKVCQIKSGQDTDTVFLRRVELNAFGFPAGTTVSVTVLDTDRTIEKVTLSVDKDIATCVVRLSKALREALGVAGDTDIDSPGDRPDRQFSIRLPQP